MRKPISSSYRDAENQARVMVDEVLVKGRSKLADTYNENRYFALQLISDLYYDGNHLGCQDGCIHNEGQIVCGYFISQRGLYNNTTLGKSAFDIYLNDTSTNLQKNTDKIKALLESWIISSGFKSHHQLGMAVDFSSVNNGQYGDFTKITSKNHIPTYKEYDSKNFHVAR